MARYSTVRLCTAGHSTVPSIAPGPGRVHTRPVVSARTRPAPAAVARHRIRSVAATSSGLESRLVVHRWSTPSVDWLLVSGSLLEDTVHAVARAVQATSNRRPATAVVNFSGVTSVDSGAREHCLRALDDLGRQVRVLVLGRDRLHERPAPAPEL